MLGPVTAATTARTANLDTQGAKYATIEVVLGAQLNTNATAPTISISESDTTVATTFATFNSSFSTSQANVTATVGAYHVDLKGRKRYLRFSLTPDTTTNGAVLSSVVGILDKEIRSANSGNADTVVVG
ncbi:MAG: hypothetical protein WCO50_00200 [Synechococcus sp. ELA619]